MYEKFLKLDSTNISAINNKGYALSKSKNYKDAIDCYNEGLRIKPNDKTLLINKISALRKMGALDEALDACNIILEDESDNLIVLYHKIRILYMLEMYNESLDICSQILNMYPNNADVLFDQACNYAQISNVPDCLLALESAIDISYEFKIKAKKNKAFQSLSTRQEFLKLIS